MKKYLRLTAIALCVAMLAGCGGKGPKDGEQQVEEKATSVEVQNPIIETVKDEYMYSGTIQAADTVDVTSKVSGIVKATYFKVGDKVNKGDLLYLIDDTDLQNNLKTAEASVRQAEENVKTAKQGVVTAKIGVESAQNSVATANAGVRSAQTGVDTANGASMKSQLEGAQNTITNCETNLENAKKSVSDCEVSINNAQTAYDKAKNDYDMNKQLFDVGGLSEDSLKNSEIALQQAENTLTTAKNAKEKAELGVKSAEDALAQAKTNYDIMAKEMTAENARKSNDSLNSAKTSVQTAQTGVKNAQNAVATAQNQVKSAEAGLESAKVGVTNAKQQIEYCKVTSPCSGTVLTKNAVEGAMIQGAGYQIVDLNSVDVQVNVSEQIATNVKTGDAVTINIPSLDNKKTTGSITQIPPSSNQDGTYTVKIKIPNTQNELKGGMFCEVYFAKSTSDNAVIVPRDAVMDDGDESYVFINNENTAKKVVVETGIDTGETIEVKSGLTVNDKVITKGQTYLAEGDKINIVSDNGNDVDTESENKDNKDSKDKSDDKNKSDDKSETNDKKEDKSKSDKNDKSSSKDSKSSDNDKGSSKEDNKK